MVFLGTTSFTTIDVRCDPFLDHTKNHHSPDPCQLDKLDLDRFRGL